MRGWHWYWRAWRWFSFGKVKLSEGMYGWVNGHFAIRYLYALSLGPLYLERWEAVTVRVGVPRRDFLACMRNGHPGYTDTDFEWRGSWWPACSRCGGPRSFARGTVTGETAPRASGGETDHSAGRK